MSDSMLNDSPKPTSDIGDAVARIKTGRVETVLLDLSSTFGDFKPSLDECTLEDLAGETGVYGILSHEVQTLIGATSNPNFLRERNGTEGRDPLDIDLDLPASLRRGDF